MIDRAGAPMARSVPNSFVRSSTATNITIVISNAATVTAVQRTTLNSWLVCASILRAFSASWRSVTAMRAGKRASISSRSGRVSLGPSGHQECGVDGRAVPPTLPQHGLVARQGHHHARAQELVGLRFDDPHDMEGAPPDRHLAPDRRQGQRADRRGGSS